MASAEDAGAELALAREALAAGRLYPAEQAARRAIALEPDRADAHRLLGQVLLRRQRPEPAIDAFARARELAPDAPGIERDLGLAQFAAGDFEASRASLRRALESDPDDALARLQLGRCERALGEPERAALEFERASRDPAFRQIALYELGVAHEQAGQRERARAAFESAVVVDAPSAVAHRAWTRLQAMERSELERPWHLALGAGLLYDSNVTREELDRESGDSDGAGRFELEASGELPVRDWFELEAGYDFFQSLHFEASEFDLQSHAFRVAASRPVGPVDATLAYLYSLNTLDGSRFLDYHEARTTFGAVPTRWWYAALSPALRIKRFDDDGRRDAEGGALGLLQLFALGDWERHLLVGVDGEIDDADARAFDYRGFATQAGLRWPFVVVERRQLFELRYRYRHRDYPSRSSSPSGRREDRVHTARARLELPIVRYVAVRLEYEFEDATSDVGSADYTDHKVGAMLRFEL